MTCFKHVGVKCMKLNNGLKLKKKEINIII